MNNWESLAGALARTISEFLEQPSTTENKQEEPPAHIDKFRVEFEVDPEDGSITCCTQWPTDCMQPNDRAVIMATILHNISSGAHKHLMLDSVQAYGVDVNQPEVAQSIISKWGGEIMKENGETLCVDPTNVFKGGPAT